MIKKVLSIIGARPQFIKASIVLKKLRELQISEVSVHTGQHYDYNMSDIFFKDLEIKESDYYLGIGSGNHGEQTGKMLIEIEKVLIKENPILVLVYGDTNTTLAGALSSAKLKIPVGHVEAGLRSFNKNMPEEINRILTDHVSDILFAPTTTAVKNLKAEGIKKNVFNVGDVMFDAALEIDKNLGKRKKEILEKYKLEYKNFILATIHRAENTDNKINLFNIIDALNNIANNGYKVFFPVHPRTKKALKTYNLLKDELHQNLILNEPVSYPEMIVLENCAKVIVTDSGGVQKEAYFFKTPAVIPRNETEWIELVEVGWNILSGTYKEKIIDAVVQLWHRKMPSKWEDFYGNGKASSNIAEIIYERINSYV